VRHGNFCDSVVEMHHRAPIRPTRGRQFTLRAQRDLLNRIKLMLTVQSPLAKIFPFPFDPNHFYNSCHPGPHKGRFAIVTNVGSGCDGRGLRC
jgi:hypothetical protein